MDFSASSRRSRKGQYEFPKGLFYGGRELQAGPRALGDWLKAHLANAAYVFALDLHTGLGRRGTDTLILEHGVARDLAGRALASVRTSARRAASSFGRLHRARQLRRGAPALAPERAPRFSASGNRHLSASARHPCAARGKPLAFFRRWQHSAPRQSAAHARRSARQPKCGGARRSRAGSRRRGPLRDGLSARGRFHELRAVRAHGRRVAVAGRAAAHRARGRGRLSRAIAE